MLSSAAQSSGRREIQQCKVAGEIKTFQKKQSHDMPYMGNTESISTNKRATHTTSLERTPEDAYTSAMRSWKMKVAKQFPHDKKQKWSQSVQINL